jgi:hypothetical protein
MVVLDNYRTIRMLLFERIMPFVQLSFLYVYKYKTFNFPSTLTIVIWWRTDIC